MQPVVKYRRASTHRRDGRVWQVAARAWDQAAHATRVLEARLSLLKFTCTVAAFLAFLCVLPCLLLLYTGIKCWRLAVGVWAVRACEGVEEVTGVTVRAAMEGPTDPGTESLLLCLAGEPHVALLRSRILEEVVNRRDSSGQLLHPNFRRRLVQVGGYYAWRSHAHFDIEKHVVLAPHHHRGRLLTARNIQEYVSEVISEDLPKDLPPWRVTVVRASAGDGEGRTWVVCRAHHLLAGQLSLPDLLVTAYPDPWQHPATRSLTLLAAPAATRTFLDMVVRACAEATARGAQTLEAWWAERRSKVLAPVLALLKEALREAKVPAEEVPQAKVARSVELLLGLVQVLWREGAGRLDAGWATLSALLHVEPAFHGLVACLAWAAAAWWQVLLWWLWTPVATWRAGRRVWRWAQVVRASKEWRVTKAALVEVYWMVRAFVTLPRLVLEEALTVRGVTPLMGWVGRRQRTLSMRGLGRTGGLVVAWSDPVPLSTARGVRGATGATLSEVLLTASSGAVRDYLRVTGLSVPEEVCCTVPVYSRRWAESRGAVQTPGLVTLALPTGATDSSTALQMVQRSMENIRRYPERYLASVWLLRNVSYFLPESLLGATFRALSVRYPVLMSNLAGPSSTVRVWGHDLLNIFYWRPPQAGAVLSVCVASYQGRAYLGVVADGRVVPNPATLPQAFVTHLNELAVDKGVRLERQFNRSWSRSSSPGATPTPTPPPTPTSPQRATTFFSPWIKHKKPPTRPTRRQSSVF